MTSPDDFLKRFEQNLRSRVLLKPRTSLLIGCSGGPDSVCLLHLLVRLREQWNFRLRVLHLNHGLRGRAANRDEAFVKKLAWKLKLPVYSRRRAVLQETASRKLSPEEACREIRYRFFAEAARHFKIFKIALAHTQDDQAETVLMRMLQGTGLRGLAAIRTQIRQGRVTYVRPLLEFSKKEILQYLKENALSYCRDGSNHSMRFVRNRIRKKLLPLLAKEINPRVSAALARIPVIAEEENEALEGLVRRTWSGAFKSLRRSRLCLDRKRFLDCPPAVQFRILEKAVKKLDPSSGVNFEAWQTIKRELSRRRFQHSLPRNINFVLTPRYVLVGKKALREQ